jgi:hypothetical protein
MIQLLQTLVFNLFCIILFTIIYYLLGSQFSKSAGSGPNNLLDFFQLSTTVQAGVGVTNLYPSSTATSVAMIAQQFVMLSTHLITIYLFTL